MVALRITAEAVYCAARLFRVRVQRNNLPPSASHRDLQVWARAIFDTIEPGGRNGALSILGGWLLWISQGALNSQTPEGWRAPSSIGGDLRRLILITPEINYA